MTYLPITDHGLIGDLHTSALVGVDGRLVWLPWPRFDSPSMFAALLDAERGGDWSLAPTNVTASQQAYDGETAILITRFETATGRAELYDWMTPWDGDAPRHDLFRMLRCTDGEIEIMGRFAPRPDYARTTTTLEKRQDSLVFQAHDYEIHFTSDHLWKIEEDTATLHTKLRAGDEIGCILSSREYIPINRIPESLEKTRSFWQDWLGNCCYTGRWQEAVRRSAITLKLLTYAPNGAIIAAPTTSLPEWIGGVRNWDYRYTWLRDASFTLYALYRLGYRREGHAFFKWLTDRAQGNAPPLQIMYAVDGESKLEESELEHLEGYRCSRPVRIGNGAYEQTQLDVYGGLIDAAYAYEQQGEFLTIGQWKELKDEIDYVCDHWTEPDHGIWEMRGSRMHHTFSKAMCWLTLDRGIRIAEDEGWSYDRERWYATRDAIRHSVLSDGWNEQVGAFTMAYESSELDASMLALPIIGFLPADDPRVQATVERINQHLSRDALVYRYRMDDGLPGDEGAFLLCSFWMVDALVLMGRIDEAVQRFETLLGYSSVHGLLSEEVDPETGTALGNYPQAFSHIGVINSALLLDDALNRLENGK
jgi:GH15 family glucan-1,4-alpha-glucosidase